MNLLMLGVGAAGLDDPRSEPVQRHLEYARRLGGTIDLIADSPRPMRIEHGPGLRVWTTGTGRMAYVARATRLALQAARDRSPDLITTQEWHALSTAAVKELSYSEIAQVGPYVVDGATPEQARLVLSELPMPLRLVHRFWWNPRYQRVRRWG